MSEELLEKGMALAQAGKQKEACELLMQVIGADVHNETAWVWYAQTLPTKDDRIRALEECLHHNPNCQVARTQLIALKTNQAVPDAAALVPSDPMTWFAEEESQRPADVGREASTRKREGLMTGKQKFILILIPVAGITLCGMLVLGWAFMDVTLRQVGLLPSRTPSPTPISTVTPSSTPTPSATVIPSATPVPSPRPVPSATPIPSATPVPSATPIPSMTPTSSLTPTPAPTKTPTPRVLAVREIEEAKKQMTALQWEVFAQGIVGEPIRFSGEVIEVYEDGRVQIDEGEDWFFYVILYRIPLETAVALDEDQFIRGVGVVRAIDELLGTHLRINVTELH